MQTHPTLLCSVTERILEKARKAEEEDGSGPKMPLNTVATLKAKALHLHSRAAVHAGLLLYSKEHACARSATWTAHESN